MKKLFKSNKPKPSELNPTPLALPPETPIHARHASSQTAQTLPRKSLDTPSTIDWVVLDSTGATPNSRSRTNSKPGAVATLPAGASPPQSISAGSPVPAQVLQQQPQQRAQSRSQPQPQPPLSPTAESHIPPAAPPKEPSRRRSAQIFPWPDSRLPEHTNRPSDTTTPRPPSTYSVDTHEGSKDLPKERRIADFFFASSKDRSDKDSDKQRHGHKPKEPQWNIEDIIRNLVQTSSEDWTIVFDICEQVSKNEAAAKDASRGLRRAFKYAQASPQLTAARLWAFMLRNTSDIFLRETSGRKFMDAVEEVVTNPKTEPVVRERLLDVLGSAVSEYTKGDRKHPYAVLWRKLKSKNQPEQGIPLDPDDPMFSPPIHVPPHNRQNAEWAAPNDLTAERHTPTPPPTNLATHPGALNSPNGAPNDAPTKLKRKPRDGERDRDRDRDRDRPRERRAPEVPSIDVEIQRIVSECEAAHSKAQILSENVALANPDEVEAEGGGIIQEFYQECVRAQERIIAQISWATSEAEKSREAHQAKLAAEALSLPAIPNGTIAPHIKTRSVVTKEEEMLGVLLSANQALTDAIQLRDDWQRAAIAQREERYVEERSRVETRIDRSQMYMAADGSLYAPEHDPRGAGSSRTPSPSPRSLARHINDSASSFGEELTPMPQNGSRSYAQSQDMYNNSRNAVPPSLSQHASSYNQLQPGDEPRDPPRIQQEPPTPRTPPIPGAGTRAAPHGPRAPLSHSRTPSPDLSAHAQQVRSTNAGGTVGAGMNAGDATLRGQFRHLEVTSPPPGFPAQPQSQNQLRAPQPQHQNQQGYYAEWQQQQALQLQQLQGSRRGSGPYVNQSNSGLAPTSDLEGQTAVAGERDYSDGAPLVPSNKALGKRRAIEKPVDPDAFDPDDLFKDPRRGAQTPLSLYGVDSHTSNPNSDSSDEDTPGHYGHHHHPKLRNKPVVYVYDAAAEREAERKKELELEEAQRSALSPKRPPVVIH